VDLEPIYATRLGAAYCADSLDVLPQIPAASIDLVITSPPYGLHFKKEYGNVDQEKYVDWILPFAHQIKRVLKPDGSFVLNVGGSWTPSAPVRSLYPFRLLIALCDEVGFQLAQEFFWYNPAKLPAPAEWVNVRRIRVKDSVEYIYWLSPSEFPKADNTKVLQQYSDDMRRLIGRGVRATRRPSGHNITVKFSKDRGGSIPANLIQCGNTESNSAYIKACRRLGRKVHPARFPAEIPRFFINLLTDPGDLVLDPFAGSNTTGAVADQLERRWISIEINREYAEDSKVRFEQPSDPMASLLASEGEPSGKVVQGHLF
jgi:site-specific DNA-methyltransferase (cytosine-N4-specific)